MKVFTGDREELRKNLWSLDLGPIIFKAMDSEEGEGWSEEDALQIAEEYRRFLFLTVTSAVVIVPTKRIDTFWHYHILDTKKYAEDTQSLFGFFLHHFPYFGMRGPDDKLALEKAFQESAAIYQTEFGTAYGDKSTDCQPSCSDTGTCNAVSDEPSTEVRPYMRPQQSSLSVIH